MLVPLCVSSLPLLQLLSLLSQQLLLLPSMWLVLLVVVVVAGTAPASFHVDLVTVVIPITSQNTRSK